MTLPDYIQSLRQIRQTSQHVYDRVSKKTKSVVEGLHKQIYPIGTLDLELQPFNLINQLISSSTNYSILRTQVQLSNAERRALRLWLATKLCNVCEQMLADREYIENWQQVLGRKSENDNYSQLAILSAPEQNALRSLLAGPPLQCVYRDVDGSKAAVNALYRCEQTTGAISYTLIAFRRVLGQMLITKVAHPALTC